MDKTLLESEINFRLLVDEVKDFAIFALDKNGYIISWNKGAKRLKGYDESEIIGKHFSIFYGKDEVDSGKCEYELEEAALTGRFEDEGWRLRKDGMRFWANVIITAIRDEHGDLIGYSKITRDLTERKRAEDKLRRLSESLDRRVHARTAELARTQEELKKALRSRDEFISLAVHELKNPIATIMMQSELINSLLMELSTHPQNSAVAADLRELAGAAKRSGQRLNYLIEDMFDASLIRKGKLRFSFEPIKLSQNLQDFLKSWNYALNAAGCELTTKIEEEIVITADQHRLEQVWSNLLTNVIKYASGKPVQVELTKKNEKCYFIVRDHGPGIDQESQQKIFQIYERGKSTNMSGLGLGLYISKSIIEAHRGAMSVKSKPNMGSEFTICLPLEIH